MKYLLPTRIGDNLYDRKELELWQSGCLTGALLGFLLGLLLAGVACFLL